MDTLNSQRLILRPLVADDAPFILTLLNDPDWLKYIGDKGVHSLEDAKQYIINGPQAMYQRHGFGLLAVQTSSEAQAMGLCGLLQRDNLPMPDIGFAYLPEARAKGYAREAAQAVLQQGFAVLGCQAIAGITASDNQASIGLLKKLGFNFKRMFQMSPGAPDSCLFELTKTAWAKSSPVLK